MTDNGTTGGAALAGSRLDWLRAKHDALKADRTVDLAVPGYDGRVVVRYGPVPWGVMSNVQPMILAGDADAAMFGKANADVVIAACRDVLVRDDGEDDLHGIDPEGPVRFGPELADLIGADAKTARGVVEWLFPSEWAVAAHATELITWTQNAAREDNDTLAGR